MSRTITLVDVWVCEGVASVHSGESAVFGNIGLLSFQHQALSDFVCLVSFQATILNIGQ